MCCDRKDVASLKVVGMDGLKRYHGKVTELLGKKAGTSHTHLKSQITDFPNIPKQETGTWTPRYVYMPIEIPFEECSYVRNGDFCLVSFTPYLLFDSDAFPMSEEDKETFLGNHVVYNQRDIDEFSNRGITFSDDVLKDGLYYTDMMLNYNSLPFGISKLISVSVSSDNSNDIQDHMLDMSIGFTGGAHILYFRNIPITSGNSPKLLIEYMAPARVNYVNIFYKI